MDKLDAVLGEIARFRDDRDWAQFHTPKNLAAALSIESAELQQLMLWKTDDEIAEQLSTPDGRGQCMAELAPRKSELSTVELRDGASFSAPRSLAHLRLNRHRNRHLWPAR